MQGRGEVLHGRSHRFDPCHAHQHKRLPVATLRAVCQKQLVAQHKVRRLPVIDGHDLVGIVSLADIARELEDDSSKGDLIEAISEDPSQ
jgi:CBS domain-containing protein